MSVSLSCIAFWKDTCQGDSGGPMWVERGSKHTAYLVGIVSRGGECAAKDSPGVVTRVKRHLKWIKKTAANHIGK